MESIQVAIRVRPFLPRENTGNTTIIFDETDDRKIRIGKSLNYFESFYDKIFFQKASQESLYKFISPAITKSKTKGINCTIFAYGQTGSGKTYTMFGSDWTLDIASSDYIDRKFSLQYDKYNFIKNEFMVEPFSESNGIIPRVITSLFTNTPKDMKISCSYIQIYNEKIYDGLNEELSDDYTKRNNQFSTFSKINRDAPMQQRALNIRENKVNGIYIDGAVEVNVESFYDCFNGLKQGEKNRKKRQTSKNEMSSRSHTIFIIILTKIVNDDQGIKTKINLCDGAGSEKNEKSESPKSIHFSEMVNINLSLTAGGTVINTLVSKPSGYIPYKNSKLTKMLQDSLGGKAMTYMITTISPSDDCYEESLSSGKFADRAHNVMSKIEVNDMVCETEGTAGSNNEIVTKLKNEGQELKQLLNIRSRRLGPEDSQSECLKLKEENYQLRKGCMENGHDNIDQIIKENIFLKNEIKRMMNGNTGTSRKSPLNTQFEKYNRNQVLTPSSSKNTNPRANESEQLFSGVGKNVINSRNNFNNIGYHQGNYRIENGNLEIIKSNQKGKMLEQGEEENKLKTQKMIDEIKKKKYSNGTKIRGTKEEK